VPCSVNSWKCNVIRSRHESELNKSHFRHRIGTRGCCRPQTVQYCRIHSQSINQSEQANQRHVVQGQLQMRKTTLNLSPMSHDTYRLIRRSDIILFAGCCFISCIWEMEFTIHISRDREPFSRRIRCVMLNILMSSLCPNTQHVNTFYWTRFKPHWPISAMWFRKSRSVSRSGQNIFVSDLIAWNHEQFML